MASELEPQQPSSRRRWVLLACLLLYAIMYLISGATVRSNFDVTRQYQSRGRAILFIPAAWIEALLTGQTVNLYVRERRDIEPPAPPFHHTADWGF